MANKDYRQSILKLMQQEAKKASKGGKTTLITKEIMIDSDGTCQFDKYRQRLDTYHLKLYNAIYSDSSISNKELDNAFFNVVSLLLPVTTTESLIKVLGNHKEVLLSAKYGRQLTPKAKARIKTLRAKIKKVEEDSTLSDEDRLEKIESLEDSIKAIRDGNNYELPLYNNLSATAFRRQFESVLIYKLAQLETASSFKSLDITGSKKWVATLEKIATYDGVDPVKVEAFKKACDFDGLKAYKKSLEAAYKASKLAAAEPKKASTKK